MRALRLALVAASLVATACKEDPAQPPPPPETRDEGPGCPENLALFEERLWAPVLRRTCITCHTDAGVAASTRFVLVSESEENHLQRNYDAFAAIASIDVEGTPLVLLKPQGLHPSGHGGGRVIEQGGSAAQSLALLVDWMRGDVAECNAPVADCEDRPGPRLLRRLTHDEYARTIRDLLGVTGELPVAFAADEAVRGLTNDAAALKVSGLLASQYRESSEALAQKAVTTQLARIVPCHGTPTAACADTFIAEFGGRAFRRPLTSDEILRYRALFREIAIEEDFVEAVRWTTTALLQSPHFLYRAELGARGTDGTFALTAWELATELSYLLWGTMPDAALFAAAADGSLATAEGLRSHVERLVADPRARETMDRFFDAWLQLDRLPNVPRDAQTYPELTPAVREAMRGEVSRVVGDLVARGASLGDALTSRTSFLTDALATYYGVPSPTGERDADGFAATDLSSTPYGGLLGLGAVTTTHALPTGSSPIHRGKLVRERLLCQDLPLPPANLDTSPPAVDPTKSTRERYAEHAANRECRECHQLIDPIGFAFEHFDGAGRWRERDGAHAIDASGEIVGSLASNGSFDGLGGLSSHLATSPDVHHCWADTWVRYGTGMREADGLACALAKSVSTTADLGAVRRALATTTHFGHRTGGAEELDGPAAGPFTAPPPPEELPPVPADRQIVLTLVEDSRWTSGACFTGTVVNRGTETVEWRVVADVDGTIDNIWNARYEPAGTRTAFLGVEWNRTVAAGGTVTFGYCTSF